MAEQNTAQSAALSAAQDMAAIPMASSLSSSSTIYIEDKGTVYRATILQLKTLLDSMAS